MKKPAHQWQTRALLAVRQAVAPAAFSEDPRAEGFDLHDASGRRVGEVAFGLDRQAVSAALALDREVRYAARCWLAARGRFDLHLHDESGRALESAPFRPDDLSDPPEGAAQRVITLAPSNAEVVEALGAFDRVIACEDSSDRPAAVVQLERLGPDLGPNLDRVAALHPDVVVSSLSVPGMERVVTGLRARGVPQVVLAPRTLHDILGDLERVGRVLGCEARAAKVVLDLQAQMQALRESAPASPVRVYLEWWPRPMFSPGRDTYADELIALAGGVNVFGDRPGASVQIEPAELVAAAPDLCFVSWCGVAERKLDPNNLRGRPGLEQLPAAVAGRVFVLDEALSGRPGPGVFEAARRIAERIRAFRRGG